MPTIDELPAAISVSDTDEIVVSQNDIARKATRLQILSGVQPELAVPQNSLLGRLSLGIGAPENIAIGANLIIRNGTIDAPAAFDISESPVGAAPRPGDLVAVAEGGQNTAVDYATFMSGLVGLSGIVGSNLVATSRDGIGVRRLADILADAISIESFGAVGDGVTDDTAAFMAALQVGKTIRLDSRIYIINGPLLIDGASCWVGVPGGSVVRRGEVIAQQVWIEIAGSQIYVSGIIFDENSLAAAESPAVQVDVTCLAATFECCQFLNARGSVDGTGLRVSCGVGSTHSVISCQFCDNELHGMDVSGNGTVILCNCSALANNGNGINVASETACYISKNTCNNNSIGISVGNWQAPAPNTAGSVLSVIEDNVCFSNTNWGVAVAGYAASVKNNSVTQNGSIGGFGGGIIARLGASSCLGNRVSGGGTGIDARTSWGSQISSNHISHAATGVLLGGCNNLLVESNFCLMNQWGFDVSAIEPALSYNVTGPVSIINNWIGFTAAQGGGIFVHDGVTGICLINNDLNGWGSAIVSQAFWLHTDQALVRGNRWNNSPQFQIESQTVGGLSALVVPDLADEAMVTLAVNPIESLLTAHQADTLGQITFVRVNAGGSGYTNAQVSISGVGHGAAAVAVISDGQLLYIVVTNAGSGYGKIGNGVIVTVTGDGAGAAATAYVGLPVLNGRHVRLNCNCAVQLAVEGTSPSQENWTNFAATIPALGAVEVEGVFGAWRAASFPSADYVQPTGDGGAVLRSSAGGNVTLRPGSGGSLQISNANELNGCTFNVGRGAPTGSVAAPPGSDFRNLDGGAGNTMWIKQTGTDASGWIAVA